MSGVPPKFPMIWTLFKPNNIFVAPFGSLYTTHRPVGIHGSPRAFGAARLLRLALQAERPRVKMEVSAYAASAGIGWSDSCGPYATPARGSIDTPSGVTPGSHPFITASNSLRSG